MARISADEKAFNKAAYDAVIFQLFVTEGWGSVTYNRLSRETGVRQSTLQGYYPSKFDIVGALENKIFPMYKDRLDFTSTEGFVRTWSGLVETDKVFNEVMKMVIESIMDGSAGMAKTGISNTIRSLMAHMSEQEAYQSLKIVLGETLFFFIFNGLQKISK